MYSCDISLFDNMCYRYTEVKLPLQKHKFMCREDLVSAGVGVCFLKGGGGVRLHRLNIHVEMWVDTDISTGLYTIEYSTLWYQRFTLAFISSVFLSQKFHVWARIKNYGKNNRRQGGGGFWMLLFIVLNFLFWSTLLA